MNPLITARIPPAPDLPPAGTKLNPVSKQLDKQGRWRLLSDEWAYLLTPVCDSCALPVTELPPCEKWWVVACCSGYPDFEHTHPDEYSALKRRFLAGEIRPWRGAMPPPGELEKHWPSYLIRWGNVELWEQVADDEMREHWLVPDKDRSPAFMLMLCASEKQPHQRKPSDPVSRDDLNRIRYRAFFGTGDKHTIVYLSEFVRDSITVEEMPHTPSYEKRQGQVRAENMAIATKTEKIIEKGRAVAEELTAAAKEVRKATEIGDLYSNPSMADAKDAAIKRDVPKEFVAYCHAEMHGRKFPTTDQAWKAVQSLPLFRALRDPKAPSRSTVYRWLSVVRKELETRGQLQPRAKGPTAQKAARYDVDKHPAPSPETTTLEDEEYEQECDTRSQELPD